MNKRQHSVHEDDQPWTTARCNRLLRPISSRIAILRKDLEKRKFRATENSHGSGQKASATERSACPTKDQKSRCSAKNADPDWIPNAKPGAGAGRKRTYGGRAIQSTKASKQKSAITFPGRPGEVSVDTPIISRTLSRVQDTPQNQGSPLRHMARKGHRALLHKPIEQLQALRKDMTPELWKQVDGLFDAYSNLLQATKPQTATPRKGPRSLISMCVRQVPTYIALEEYFLEEDGEDEDNERDLANEIYTELEDRGGCGGVGWRPIKEIVRAHGTALLCDAFEDKVLRLETLQGIYKLCINAGAHDEAEKFLASFLVVLKPISPPTSASADLFDVAVSPYMRMLKNFLDVTRRYSFFYDQIEYMISQDLLPLEWLATGSMLPIWSKIVRTLSDTGNYQAYANAYRLLETAVSLGAGLPADGTFDDGEVEIVTKQTKISSKSELREALNNTFSSLLTLLCSIALVSNSRDTDGDRATVQSVTWALDSLLIDMIKRKDIRSDLELLSPSEENRETFARRAVWCAAAPFLVHLGRCSLEHHMINLDLTTLISSINWIIGQYSSDEVDMTSVLESLPSFISSTAQCSGRVWKDDGFDQLQHFVDALTSVKSVKLTLPAWSFKRIALDSCFEFAQNTKNSDHFVYARRIEQMLTKAGRSMVVRSPEKAIPSPRQSAGFRWEEGIGEWVACTPFARKDVNRLPRKIIRRTSPIVRIVALPSPAESQRVENNVVSIDVPDESTEQLPDSPVSLASEQQSPEPSPIKEEIYRSVETRSRSSIKRPLEQAATNTVRKSRRISAEDDTENSSDVSRAISVDRSSSSSRAEASRSRRTLRQSVRAIAPSDPGQSRPSSPVPPSPKFQRRGRGRPRKATVESNRSNASTERIGSRNGGPSKIPVTTSRSSTSSTRPCKATHNSSFSTDLSDEDELGSYDGRTVPIRKRTSRRSLRRQASTAAAAVAKAQASLLDLVDLSEDELSFG